MVKRCLEADICKRVDKTLRGCLSGRTVLMGKERCGERKEAGNPPLLRPQSPWVTRIKFS